LLGGCVALTWLIACANVAILMIAQWTAREHEIAVRAALGAGRGRVIRLLLTESVILAVTGGLLGICVTFALRGLILRYAGSTMALFNTSINPRILVQSAILTIATGMLAGMAPALYETRRLQTNPLRAITSERLRQRWRHLLVIAEITATVALLVVTSQMIEGYRHHLAADVGFPTKDLVIMRVENPNGVRATDILEFLKGVPGIRSAAAATSAPFAGGTSELYPVAIDPGDGSGAIKAEWLRVSPTFFATLGVPIRSGRAFSTTDAVTAPTVAIVNEALARRLWANGTALGRRVRVNGGRYDVIGVVGDYRYFPISSVTPAVYVPLSSEVSDLTRLQFVSRAATGAGPLIAGLRRDIRRIASGYVVASALTADEWIATGGQEILAGTAPLIPLIAIGMLLTASGVYAVLAFAVARRSKEFALRTALGASTRDIVRLVVGHSVRLLLIGSVLGVVVTFALSRVVRAIGGAGSLFDTPDWPAFVIPCLIMLGVAAIATWIPTQRALQAEPAMLLRVD
jgi:predicted permease